jgi:kinesin family protein C1
MEGPGIDSELEMAIVDPETRGMIPRAVEQIFTSADSLKDKGWTYEMEVMYLEIYNETIRDLLIPNPSKVKEEIKYEIKHDQKGVTTVTNVTTGISSKHIDLIHQ